MDSPSEYKSLQETADYFGVSPHSVRDWIRKDKLPPDSCIKLGGTYRLKYKLIEEWAFDEYQKNTSNSAEDDVNLDGPVELEIEPELEPATPEPFLIDEEDGEFY